MWTGIVLRLNSVDSEDIRRTKETYASVELLLQHGVTVDETDFMGCTALMYATGCLNPDLISDIKFAECVPGLVSCLI